MECADHQVTRDAVCLGRHDQFDGPVAVHCAFALRLTAGPGASGKNHGVGAADGIGNVAVRLNVADDRYGAGSFDLHRLIGAAD
jgi:hypothetical protein